MRYNSLSTSAGLVQWRVIIIVCKLQVGEFQNLKPVFVFYLASHNVISPDRVSYKNSLIVIISAKAVAIWSHRDIDIYTWGCKNLDGP